MANDLMVAQYDSLSGIQVKLDADTVRKMLVKGKGKVSDTEIAFFIRTCAGKKLDPFENGEVSLIKYSDDSPAQMVVGYQAYVRRADSYPEYRGYKAGITVLRNGEIIQKEGACVYKALKEELLGGWCRVFRERGNGYMDETFMEVALDEYSTGKSNWRDKPATMIRKCAISQAFRNAFPNEYEGLYTTEEMAMSGAIPVDYVDSDDKNPEVIKMPTEPRKAPQSAPKEQAVAEATVTKEQRKELFSVANEAYGDATSEKLKELIKAEGFESTTNMTVSAYERVMKIIKADTVVEAEYTEVETA